MKDYTKIGELNELKNNQKVEELLLQLKMLSSEKNSLRVQNQANERRIKKRNDRILQLERNLKSIKDKLSDGTYQESSNKNSETYSNLNQTN